MQSSTSSPVISSSSVKEEFVKKWIKGLESRYEGCKREMSITERKNAIKLSADVAMASTTTTHDDDESSLWLWRRSVMAKSVEMKMKKISKKRCVMKSIICRRPNKYKCSGKRLVKKKSRREILKRLIPGGECMEDDNTLIKETLDYILALKLQVHVMRHLASATHQLSAFGNNTTSS